MEQHKNLDIDSNGDEIMLPGFRFHPTDEELVTFYLRRKVQQRPLSIELIKQLDIYKFDPWDLPKMATIGEKEWYFYCPRDRKYRNSNRPNRVTSAGFWKATGTDRPIYSSDGTKCIGLKKSLVFYKGRAAKGIKTDWMMHEFRLPSLTAPNTPCKRSLEKELPPNDSWAICRIFKKSTVAQRAPPHLWAPAAMDPIMQNNNFMSCNNYGHNDNVNQMPNYPVSVATSNLTSGDEFKSYYGQEEPTSLCFGGGYKLCSTKPMFPAYPSRSTNVSLSNLDFSSTTDLPHMEFHAGGGTKNTLNFGGNMFNTSPMGENASEIVLPKPEMTSTNETNSNGSPGETNNYHADGDGCCIDQPQFQSEDLLLKKSDILTNQLHFQSHLYEVLKGHVSVGPWEIATSSLV